MFNFFTKSHPLDTRFSCIRGIGKASVKKGVKVHPYLAATCMKISYLWRNTYNMLNFIIYLYLVHKKGFLFSLGQSHWNLQTFIRKLTNLSLKYPSIAIYSPSHFCISSTEAKVIMTMSKSNWDEISSRTRQFTTH